MFDFYLCSNCTTTGVCSNTRTCEYAEAPTWGEFFPPLKFAVHIIHVLYSREAEAHSEVVRINMRLDGMIDQNAFARDEMVRIGKAERLFEEHRRMLDADVARYLARISTLEQKLAVVKQAYSDLRGGYG